MNKQTFFWFFIFFFVAITCHAAPNNLDEMIARKERHAAIIAAGTANENYLENPTTYIWQPETLIFFDSTTGREVIRYTNTPSDANKSSNITWPIFSADGKRIAFASTRNDLHPDVGIRSNAIYMVSNTDGTYMKSTMDSPAVIRSSYTDYFIWSPAEIDTWYVFGYESGFPKNVLYKITVNDSSFNSAPYLTLSTDNDTIYTAGRNISPNGQLLVAYGYSTDWITPLVIYPSGSKEIKTYGAVEGYQGDRGWGTLDSILPVWGDTPNGAFYGYHAYPHVRYMPAFGDYYSFFQLSGSSAKWMQMVLGGSASDGGPEYAYDSEQVDPYDKFVHATSSKPELVPINTVVGAGTRDPFGIPYMGHPCVDMWGHYVIYGRTNELGAYAIGASVRDLIANTDVVTSFEGGVLHNDWHSWSDYPVASAGGGLVDPATFEGEKIYRYKYDDSNSRTDLCYTYTRYNGNYVDGDYDSLPRPTQSPDGTKIAFNSTFLNAKIASTDDRPDIYAVVAYYPHPPEITGASKSGANVRLQFEWMLDSTPRGYTTRGWPDEAVNDPPPPREIEWFIVWRSLDGSTWEYVTKVANPVWTNYDFSTGSWGANPDYVTADVSQDNSTTVYYIATSRETSGLESRQRSNIWEVTLDGGGAITTQQEKAVGGSYPSNPGASGDYGAALFTITDTIADPSGVSVTVCDTGDCSAYPSSTTPTADGQNLVTWTEPANTDLVRGYHIYYDQNDSTPDALQENRIATVPVGTTQFLDVFAAGTGNQYYTVKSFGFQGQGAGQVHGSIKILGHFGLTGE